MITSPLFWNQPQNGFDQGWWKGASLHCWFWCWGWNERKVLSALHGFFISVKFATSLLALLAGGLKVVLQKGQHKTYANLLTSDPVSFLPIGQLNMQFFTYFELCVFYRSNNWGYWKEVWSHAEPRGALVCAWRRVSISNSMVCSEVCLVCLVHAILT